MTEPEGNNSAIVISTATEATAPSHWDQITKGLRVDLVGAGQVRESFQTALSTLTTLNWETFVTHTLQSTAVIAASRLTLDAVTAALPSPAAIAEVSKRAYPHLLEAAEPALILMRQALQDSRAALACYGNTDFDGVASKLSFIAVLCAQAHKETAFNESFGAVVSYIRRAMIAATPSEIDRDTLNSMVHALSELIENPLISLPAAGDLLDFLSKHGWHGELEAIERLIALVLGEHFEESSIAADA